MKRFGWQKMTSHMLAAAMLLGCIAPPARLHAHTDGDIPHGHPDAGLGDRHVDHHGSHAHSHPHRHGDYTDRNGNGDPDSEDGESIRLRPVAHVHVFVFFAYISVPIRHQHESDTGDSKWLKSWVCDGLPVGRDRTYSDLLGARKIDDSPASLDGLADPAAFGWRDAKDRSPPHPLCDTARHERSGAQLF